MIYDRHDHYRAIGERWRFLSPETIALVASQELSKDDALTALDDAQKTAAAEREQWRRDGAFVTANGVELQHGRWYDLQTKDRWQMSSRSRRGMYFLGAVIQSDRWADGQERLVPSFLAVGAKGGSRVRSESILAENIQSATLIEPTPAQVAAKGGR
jgi:hypothetical protein